MHNGGRILAGILIFLALGTSPFWYGRGRTAAPPDPSLDTPEIKSLAVKQCVEPAPYMRGGHMTLLEKWREEVVRDGNRLYANHEGKQFPMSLSQTCLGCHSNKERFCDACHSYAGVKPACWSCHTAPREGRT
jgi:hypothetical protein